MTVTHDASSVRFAQLLQHKRRGGGSGRCSSSGVVFRFQERPARPPRVRRKLMERRYCTGRGERDCEEANDVDDGATPAARENRRGKVDLNM